jgi:hypothetical protein
MPLALMGEEVYRLLDGVINDDANLFNDKLQEWAGLLQLPSPSGRTGRTDPLRGIERKTNSTNPDTVVKDVRQLHKGGGRGI